MSLSVSTSLITDELGEYFTISIVSSMYGVHPQTLTSLRAGRPADPRTARRATVGYTPVKICDV